jgi:hypothetical protein
LLFNILDTTATQPLNFNRHLSDQPPASFFDVSKPLDINAVWDLWNYVSVRLVKVVASATTPGLFQSVVLQNNLSNFAIEIEGPFSKSGSNGQILTLMVLPTLLPWISGHCT